MAAQLTEGARPDVVIIPESLLGRGGVAAYVAAREHASEPLLRTIALAGGADELSLADVAEQRMLFVEASPSWDRRVAIHVVPSEALLAFLPPPVSSIEQHVALANATPARERLFTTVAADAPLDAEAQRLVRGWVRNETAVLVRSGNLMTAGENVLVAERTSGDTALDRSSTEVVAAIVEAAILERTHAKERALASKPRVADQEKRKPRRRR